MHVGSDGGLFEHPVEVAELLLAPSERAEFLVRLAERFNVRVWGQDWERYATKLNWDGSAVYGRDFAKVCASAKIVLDVKPRMWDASLGVYSSNRLVRQIASLVNFTPPM